MAHIYKGTVEIPAEVFQAFLREHAPKEAHLRFSPRVKSSNDGSIAVGFIASDEPLPVPVKRIRRRRTQTSANQSLLSGTPAGQPDNV